MVLSTRQKEIFCKTKWKDLSEIMGKLGLSLHTLHT
jgi:hypothetical protein